MKTTTSIIQELRVTNSDKTHPIKLRVTHSRKQKYYTLNVKPDKSGLSVFDWEKVMDEKSRGEYKVMRGTLQKSEAEAIQIITHLPNFTFEAFETIWFKKQTVIDLFASLDNTAEAFRKEGRIKTAITYEAASKSLKAFSKKDKLLFTSVTPEYLRKYEKWMLTIGNSKKKKGIRLAIGNSKTTISMYLRTVRAAFNKVGIKDDSYPFGRGKYELPISRNIKKALTIQDISKIFKYDALEGSTRAKCRDYWLLSYLCNGANIKDLALLKYKDINDESITFIRSKTSRKISRAVVVPMTVEIGRIIDKYGNKPAFRNSYILPILSNGLDPERQRIAIDNTVRLINNEIKVIATNIGITANVTTYTARHSFATVLKRSGASMEFISESLGHHSLSTTENYLADFEMDKKREMAALLTKWNDSIEISNPPELIKENESFQESA